MTSKRHKKAKRRWYEKPPAERRAKLVARQRRGKGKAPWPFGRKDP